jgi:hypothetical protein
MTRPRRKPKIVWYARGGGIERAGPFGSQVEAVAAMRLVPPAPMTALRILRGDTEHPARTFPADIFVWPEER